ncbi:MAG: Maf family protein [Mariprofundus sp.]|nr:Maf family protein [Mariprofundus sp.]
MRLILASTSTYRRKLLNRLCLPFEQISPDFEEKQPGSMTPEKLVRFNTLGKAQSVLSIYPDATVIASDQIAVCDKLVLGKPGNIEKACNQLRMLSGRTVTFMTGLAVLSEHAVKYETIPFHVSFRQLADDDIRTYVGIEQPLDCTGSFKSEGLGICLFERLQGDDPTALIGLPLIRLSQWLEPLKQL